MIPDVGSVSGVPSSRRDSDHPTVAAQPAEFPASEDQVQAAVVGRSAAVGHQQIVATAVGYLMTGHRCTARQALGILLEVAARTDRSPFDVASGLVARHTRVDEALVALIPATTDPPTDPPTGFRPA